MQKLLFVLIGIGGVLITRAQIPGALDPEFGDSGIVLLDHNYNSQNNSIMASAIQDDGKLVFGGWSYGVEASGYNFIRLMPDGTPDASFGNNGVVVINQGSPGGEVWDLCIQNDSKIVGIGSTEDSINSNSVMAVVRINSDGSLDTDFGVDGIREISTGPKSNTFGHAITMQNDGKILVCGILTFLPDWETIVCRLNQDGTLDNTFGEGGIVLFDIQDKIEYLNSINIQGNKIIVGGHSYDDSGEVIITLVRFHMDGTIDAEFGDTGLVLKPTPAIIDDLWELMQGKACIAPDNKIIYAGFADGDIDEDFAVFRFLENGNIDNSFGTNGMSVIKIDEMAYANSVVVQDDGKIIAGGYRMSSLGYDADFTMVRCLENGDPDSLFGEDGTGIVTQNISTTSPPYEDKINCLAIQADGKIVAAGFAYTEPPTFIDFAIARYNGDIGYNIYQPVAGDVDYLAYPNPFTHETTLTFELDTRSDVRIEAYDIHGRLMDVVTQQSYDQGKHQLRWNADGLTEGIYLIRMMIGGDVHISKIVKSQ